MKNIRVVSQNGKCKLHYVLLDETGYVETIYEEIEAEADDHHEMMGLIDMIAEAKKHPTIIVNAANKKMFFEDSD